MVTPMQTNTASHMKNGSEDSQAVLQRLRQLYADAPEIARTAFERMSGDFERAIQAQQRDSQREPSTAGRVGLRRGKVSELTCIWKFAPGGAKRLRALLQALGGNFQGADKVGTLHNMRFVFIDNDTKVLFATAYDGDWDPYIDDFATKIADEMDVVFSNAEGWPGIRSPKVKDWIAGSQITAEGWYVNAPNRTVTEGKRLEKVGRAVEEFLENLS